MSPEDYAALRLSVQQHEGLRLTPYTDTTGHTTIGYGHNLQDDGITQAQAEALLDTDLQKALVLCAHAWPWFEELDGPRQRVLVEMAFNMGIAGVSEFHNMLKAVQAGDYARAAAEMMRSEWALQVGMRARQLANLMQQGDNAPPTVTA